MKKILKNLSTLSLILSLTISFALQATYAQNNIQMPGDYDNNVISSCVLIQNNLRLRSKDSNTGGDVSELQSFLQDRGLLNFEPTGYFGNSTTGAVKAYQTSKGLSATGFVGPLTRAKIQSDTCNNPLPPAPQPNPQPIPLPQVCTMEARLCANGSVMPRDTDCTWRADRCPAPVVNYCIVGAINSNPYSNTANKCICPVGTVEESYISGYPTGVYQFTCESTSTNLPMCDMTGTIMCYVAQQCRYSNGGLGYGCPAGLAPIVNACPLNTTFTNASCSCPIGYTKYDVTRYDNGGWYNWFSNTSYECRSDYIMY